MNETLKQIIESEAITKAYANKDERFILVENAHGLVFTAWIARGYSDHVEITRPIVPNHTTGSSTLVTENDEPVDAETAIKIMSRADIGMPNFFSEKDRASTVFETIDGAVNRHGNILGYTQIKG